MAKKSMILKQQAKPKFSTRAYNRCKICGRPHAYLRDFGICRICFRELAYKGQIPGALPKRPSITTWSAVSTGGTNWVRKVHDQLHDAGVQARFLNKAEASEYVIPFSWLYF